MKKGSKKGPKTGPKQGPKIDHFYKNPDMWGSQGKTDSGDHFPLKSAQNHPYFRFLALFWTPSPPRIPYIGKKRGSKSIKSPTCRWRGAVPRPIRNPAKNGFGPFLGSKTGQKQGPKKRSILGVFLSILPFCQKIFKKRIIC